MLGAIIGDIVGSIYEFNHTKDYNCRLFTSRSNFTDDSIMTMAVAEHSTRGAHRVPGKQTKEISWFALCVTSKQSNMNNEKN